MPALRPTPEASERLRLSEHFEDLGKQAHAARLGMWVFLGSEVLLFAGLFTLYAAYRAMYPGAFAAAVGHNSVVIGTTNTAILLTSSLCVAAGAHEVHAFRSARGGWLLLAAIGLGLGFLTLKGVEYAQHFREGILPGAAYRYSELSAAGAPLFFTLYYVMTGLHAIHVTAGLLVLAWAARGCFLGRYGGDNDAMVELGGIYWHLVDIVWIFLWPLLYLMHG